MEKQQTNDRRDVGSHSRRGLWVVLVNRSAGRARHGCVPGYLSAIARQRDCARRRLAGDARSELAANRAPPGALINFSLAGLIHFFVGWTFLNTSQKRIGASRTSPLIATNPLFAALIAALTLREFPNLLAWFGILLIIGGVCCISNAFAGGGAQAAPAMKWRDLLCGLSVACCWAISPIFTRKGLQGLPSPLLGVTVGLTASVLVYGLALLFQRRLSAIAAIPHDALFFKTVAGILAGVSTWNRWMALNLAPVAVVLALALTSVPVVMFLSPLVTDRNLERVTSRVWLGAALVVGGVLFLIFNN